MPAMSNGNFGLLWEPGAGKTLPAVVAGAIVGGPRLYLCPAALRRQTRRVATGLGISCQMIEKRGETVDDKAELVIASYGAVTDKPLFKQLRKRKWSSIVLDEAHYLKSPSASRTAAVYGARLQPDGPSKGALINTTDRVWWLTGTPILATPADLYTHFSRLIDWTPLYTDSNSLTFADWKTRYTSGYMSDFGAGSSYVPTGINKEFNAELIARLAGNVDRLTKRDVMSIGEPIFDTIEMDPHRVSLDLIEDPQVRDYVKAMLGDRVQLKRLDDLQILAPHLATYRKAIGVAKAKEIAEIALEEIYGGTDRILIAAWHTDVIKTILARFERTNVTAAAIHGGVSMAKREQICDAWDAGDIQVLVVNITAAGLGLNLQSGARLIFAELDWTASNNEQVVARLWRGGQERIVRVSFTELPGTLDRVICEVASRKARAAYQVLDENRKDHWHV